jgi:hypothetical protein
VTHYISPCVGTCLLDPETTECIGCHRNVEEIQHWNTYSAEEKNEVLIRVAKVKQQQFEKIRNMYKWKRDIRF